MTAFTAMAEATRFMAEPATIKLYGGSGTGRDVFVFDTKTNKSTNVDRIYDFNPKYDAIWLENAIFTKLGKGAPSKPMKFKSDMFVKGNLPRTRKTASSTTARRARFTTIRMAPARKRR